MPTSKISSAADEEVEFLHEWPQDLIDVLHKNVDKETLDLLKDMRPSALARHIHDGSALYKDNLLKTSGYKDLSLARRMELEAVLMDTYYPLQPASGGSASSGGLPGGCSQGRGHPPQCQPNDVWSDEEAKLFRAQLPEVKGVAKFQWQIRLIELVDLWQQAKTQGAPKETLLGIQHLLREQAVRKGDVSSR